MTDEVHTYVCRLVLENLNKRPLVMYTLIMLLHFCYSTATVILMVHVL
jgi:hypothetical protein